MGLLKLTTWFILKFSEAMEIINEEYKFGEADGVRFFIRFNEGKYGHIHFESKNGEKSGAILLERPQYFPHGNPPKYTGTLNKKELINFVKILNEEPDKMKQGWTIWHQLCYDWNKNCRDGEKIELYDHNGIFKSMPDYENIVYPR